MCLLGRWTRQDFTVVLVRFTRCSHVNNIFYNWTFHGHSFLPTFSYLNILWHFMTFPRSKCLVKHVRGFVRTAAHVLRPGGMSEHLAYGPSLWWLDDHLCMDKGIPKVSQGYVSFISTWYSIYCCVTMKTKTQPFFKRGGQILGLWPMTRTTMRHTNPQSWLLLMGASHLNFKWSQLVWPVDTVEFRIAMQHHSCSHDVTWGDKRHHCSCKHTLAHIIQACWLTLPSGRSQLNLYIRCMKDL